MQSSSIPLAPTPAPAPPCLATRPQTRVHTHTRTHKLARTHTHAHARARSHSRTRRPPSIAEHVGSAAAGPQCLDCLCRPAESSKRDGVGGGRRRRSQHICPGRRFQASERRVPRRRVVIFCLVPGPATIARSMGRTPRGALVASLSPMSPAALYYRGAGTAPARIRPGLVDGAV